MTLSGLKQPGVIVLSALALIGCNQTLPERPDENADPRPADTARDPDKRALATSVPGLSEAVPANVAQRAEAVSPETTDPGPPADVFDRLRNGFRLSIPSDPRIEREVAWYASHPEYLKRIQGRARPYLRYIVDEVEKRGMPLELALLPVVESAFQPFAYSPGRAAGLWQFIPSTGKHFNLKQNWWYDGRRDIIASTEAALDYLKSLAERFDGDWELALAGYNAGAGTVSRAIKRNRKKGKPTDFWSLKLPRETSGYVPRLLAIAKIVQNPESYDVTLSPIPDEIFLAQVDIQSQLDLARAAEMAGLGIEELYRLNPGFNRWATDPNGPHRLVLPLENVERFSRNLAELPSDQRLRWNRYRIRKGDNLGAIARKHHTTVALLQEVNGLRNFRIRAGNHLLIPVASQNIEEYSLSADQRLAGLKSQQRKGTRSLYTVQSGDSLWRIARRFGVNHKQLARWNGLSPKDILRPGSQLVIWRNEKAADNISASALPVSLNAPVNTESRVSYRVRSGDSLSRIASRFNVRIADLKKWNSLSGKYLQPGQKLNLYIDVAEQSL